MKTMSLSGGWWLRHGEAGEGEAAGWPTTGVAGPEAVPAAVPGDVHLDLTRAGLIADPLFGANADQCRWMEEKDWWYSTTFTLPDGFTGDHFELAFQGLDTLADVWLNGTLAGHTANAFIEHLINVDGLLRPGENLLVVRVDSGLRWAREQEFERYVWPNDATLRERIWLRRPQFSGGWDWGPRLLTIGIWRPVELRAYDKVALRDVYLITEEARPERATFRVKYEIESFAPADMDVTLEVRLEGEGGGRKRLATTLVPGPNFITDGFSLDSPRLWWPNGAGEPYLYRTECRVSAGDTVLDSRSMRYGIRRIRLIQEEIGPEEGQSFALAVNGRRLFCKGANWVPADSLPANATPEKLRLLVAEAARANFNMLRVWGGGVYEDDAWWDACDDQGILVWQDFMFSCSAIPDEDPGFAALVAEEARSVVKRLRNRASLALWCGNNENQWLSLTQAPHTCACGRRTYHEVLAETCVQLDPSRPYWPSSPWGGVDPNSQLLGDRHSWEIALNPDNDARVRYRDYAGDRGKFVSEYGFLAPPVEDSLRRFLPEDELNLEAPSWRFHDNTYERGVTRRALEVYFGRRADSLPLAEYLALAQAYQAEAYRYTLGHFRRRKPYCGGSLFWMYSDCWGATSGWTIIDYYLNRKPSYYAVRRVFAPLALAFIEERNGQSLWLINDHGRPVSGVLQVGRGRLGDGSLDVIDESRLTAAPDSSECVAHLVLPGLAEEARADRYYWARFTPERGEPVQATAFLHGRWADLKLAPARVSRQLAQAGPGTYRLTLRADRFTWGLWLSHGPEVLPSDNYLDLLPGLPYTITLSGPAEAVEAVRLTSLNDYLGR